MTLIGGVLAILFLPSPWKWIAVAALLVTDIIEIGIWLRWRRRRSSTGAEGMIGATGETLTDCRPGGQVRLKGQIWKAYCEPGVAQGTRVIVDHVEGLELHVRPVDQTGATTSSRPRSGVL